MNSSISAVCMTVQMCVVFFLVFVSLCKLQEKHNDADSPCIIMTDTELLAYLAVASQFSPVSPSWINRALRLVSDYILPQQRSDLTLC